MASLEPTRPDTADHTQPTLSTDTARVPGPECPAVGASAKPVTQAVPASVADETVTTALGRLSVATGPLKLLTIEDDPDQRELIRETLETRFGTGCVTQAGSKAQAMATDLGSFDLILCDYNLPDAIGLDVVAEITRRCATPVLMVTGENVGQIAQEAIRRGAADYIVKYRDYLATLPLTIEKNLAMAKINRENAVLRQQLEAALTDLRDRNHELHDTLKRVEEMAATDPLTKLYNRRHFSMLLEHMFAEAQRYGSELSCVMIDLDQYKKLNDTYGHQVGDQILTMAGKVISANMRQMDVAARYGGDEFVLLLSHASPQDAAGVAQRIGDEFALASRNMLKSGAGVTMSSGIASMLTGHPAFGDQLVALADTALYRAKDAGRNRSHICAPTPSSTVNEKPDR